MPVATYRLESGALAYLAQATGGPAGTAMWIGAAAEGNESQSQWESLDSEIGPLRARRSYHSPFNFPSSFQGSRASFDPALGLVTCLSLKPPSNDVAGMINGDYDQQLSDFAASVPSGHPMYLTVQHEPENDFDGSTYVDLHRRCYQVVKNANTEILYGYMAMSFQYGPSRNGNTDDLHAYWPGFGWCDWLGVDTYADQVGEVAETKDDVQRWLDMAGPKNLPMLVGEYGVDEALGEPDRSDIMLADEEYFASLGMVMWLYWNADLSGDWKLDLQASKDTWSAIASRGRVS